MILNTNTESSITPKLISNYFENLVNLFFKILPMREKNEHSLNTYMKSLQLELIGCKKLISGFGDDHNFLTLLSILQYLIDNPECELERVRREVFHSISICNKLKAKYTPSEVHL